MLEFRAESPPSAAFDYSTWERVFNASLDDQDARISGDEIRRLDSRIAPHIYTRRVLVYEDGEAVGCALSNHLIYLFKPGFLWIGVSVLPEHRGRGLGAKIFDEMLTALRGAVAPESLMSHAKENAPHSLGFLERRGFVMRQRFVPSCLRLERADFSLLPALRARLQDQNIRIVSLADLAETDPDYQRRLWTLIVDIEQRLPTFTTITPAPFEVFVQRVIESPMLCWRASHVAVAGDEYVGFSGLRLIQGETVRRQTGLTGVKTGYHRRGIATAMKLAVAQQAAAEGICEITTENDESNPMLTINLNLGFQTGPATRVMICDLQKQAAPSHTP